MFDHVTDPRLRAVLTGESDDLDYARMVTSNALIEDVANPDIPIKTLDRRVQAITRFLPPTVEQIKEFWLT